MGWFNALFGEDDMPSDTLTLPDDLQSALRKAARRARVKPETLLSRVVVEYLEDMHDIKAANAAEKAMHGKKWKTLEQVKKELGLER